LGSSFRLDLARERARGILLLLALVTIANQALPPAAGAARRAVPPVRAGASTTAPAEVVDDSTRAAQALVHEVRALYGGDDNFAAMDGIRYYVTFTIPGPDGAPVRTWTEAHYVWLKGEPRARIETVEDSSVVVVRGDTTLVRRGGAWVTDSTSVRAAREQALDAIYLARLPRNLIHPSIEGRQFEKAARGVPFTTRFRFLRDGVDRPPGTIVAVTFAPPTYSMRRLHTFDPRSNAWTLLDLEGDRSRYDWTWAERRTLRASDPAGEPGPVLWTATIQDLQIEGQMPIAVLYPPDAGAGVVTPPAKGR